MGPGPSTHRTAGVLCCGRCIDAAGEPTGDVGPEDGLGEGGGDVGPSYLEDVVS